MAASVPVHCECMGDTDDRECYGFYQFNRDQSYEGHFLGDSLHGQGTYHWLNVAVYDGGFYSNCKEGYASLSLPDSSYFEGLFVENKPFGPGVLTHANGRQDAGFWKGSKLVRLSRTVDFIIPRLAPTSAAKIKLLQFRHLIPLDEDSFFTDEVLKKYGHPVENFSAPFSKLIYDRRSTFFNKRAFEKSYFSSSKQRPIQMPRSSSQTTRFSAEEALGEALGDTVEERLEEKQIPPHCLCSTDVFVMKYETPRSVDVCDAISSSSEEEEMGILGYFSKYGTDARLGIEMGEAESDMEVLPSAEATEGDRGSKNKSKTPKIVSWNRNQLCTEMLKQIFRFREFEGKLNFNLSKLMVGARTAFRKTGEKEMQCLHFLKMCSLGPAHIVKSILCSHHISEELMDARGNNSLMFAAATDQHEVIEVLISYGVDVNTFNDEGLTPLNLCLLRRLAQANGISSWETAFLGKEIKETQEVESHIEGYSFKGSISSLDRIFGDGMSLNESIVYGADSQLDLASMPSPRPSMPSPRPSMPSPRPSMPSPRPSESQPAPRTKQTSSKTIMPSSSKIQGSMSLLNWDWEFRSRRSSSFLALSNPTPTLNIKIIPKSVRRDEFQKSLQKSSRDKYLFDFKISKRPKPLKEDSINYLRRRLSRKDDKHFHDDDDDDLEDLSLTVTEKIAEIDKTIILLLKKGANPNISEVPKPSLHLGIYTKDYATIYNLLYHGADPNSPLHSNESRLTPLHVLALQEPAQEFVGICELLLSFKANPEIETPPGFLIPEEELRFVDPEQGRTALQLICMRPDLEFADPNGNLTRIAVMLSKFCEPKRQYNGHSYLTLAMVCGNVRLLEALLHTGIFDPTDILGKNRGTCLHVLVSNEVQRRTSLNTSLRMCDLLIGAGANPFKWFRTPRYLRGTCVDYGYNEIDRAREEKREEQGEIKKIIKVRLGRPPEREKDPFKDHLLLVEYLANYASHWTRRKTGSRPRGNAQGSERSLMRRSTRLFIATSQKLKSQRDLTKNESIVTKFKRKTSSKPVSFKEAGQLDIIPPDFIEELQVQSRAHPGDKELPSQKFPLPSVMSKRGRDTTVHVSKEPDKEKPGRASESPSTKRKTKAASPGSEEITKSKSTMKTKERKVVSLAFEESIETVPGQSKRKRLKSVKRAKFASGQDFEEIPEDAGAKHRRTMAETKRTRKATGIPSSGPLSEDVKGKRKSKAEKTKQKRGEDSPWEDQDDKDYPSEDIKGKRRSKAAKTKKRGGDTPREDQDDKDYPSDDIKGKRKSKAAKTKKKRGGDTSSEDQDDEEYPSDDTKGKRKGPSRRQKSRDASLGPEERTKFSSLDARAKNRSTSDHARVKSALSEKGKGKRKIMVEKDQHTFSKPKRSKSREITFVDSAEGGLRKRITQKKASEMRIDSRLSSGSEDTAEEKEQEKDEGDKKKETQRESTMVKPSARNLQGRQSVPEVFPEKLRQIFLRLFGNCVNMDINEFLMPYVVLRDGELYYKFRGKASKQKEQYSLV